MLAAIGLDWHQIELKESIRLTSVDRILSLLYRSLVWVNICTMSASPNFYIESNWANGVSSCTGKGECFQ